jgi:hypothetical protein
VTSLWLAMRSTWLSVPYGEGLWAPIHLKVMTSQNLQWLDSRVHTFPSVDRGPASIWWGLSCSRHTNVLDGTLTRRRESKVNAPPDPPNYPLSLPALS